MNLLLSQQIIGLLLLLAGATKLRARDRVEFRTPAISVVGHRAGPVVAALLGPFEVALGAGCVLSWGVPRRVLLAAAAVLLLALAVAAWRLTHGDTSVTCRCFGPTSAAVSQFDIMRNAALALWAGVTAGLSPTVGSDAPVALLLLLPSVGLAVLLSRFGEVRAALA